VPLTVRRRDRVLDLVVEAAGGGNVRWVLSRDDETSEREDRLFGQWMDGAAMTAVRTDAGRTEATAASGPRARPRA
jgi:hypothetical protein